MLRMALILGGVLLAGGCATPWENNFTGNPELHGQTLQPTQSVQIREIEMERLNRYSEAERQERISSTTAPEDMTPQERTAAKDRLLEALQLQERGEQIEVLGWSEFTSYEKLDPRNGDLARFAGKIGADVVVVASAYGGQVTRTIDRPYSGYSNTYVVRGGRGGGNAVHFNTYSTTWVPVTVVSDQFFYTAAYLRRTSR